MILFCDPNAPSSAFGADIGKPTQLTLLSTIGPTPCPVWASFMDGPRDFSRILYQIWHLKLPTFQLHSSEQAVSYLDGAHVGPELVHVHLSHVPVGFDVNDGAIVNLGANLGQNTVTFFFDLLLPKNWQKTQGFV